MDEKKSIRYEPLTPVQEHYLKKDLLSRQIAAEISNLSSPTALARFGDPFKPLDPATPVSPRTTDFPFLRFVFVNFVQSFPFLHDDQRPLWQDKVQPVPAPEAKLIEFLRLFAEKNISGSLDRSETTKRRKLAKRFERLTLLLLSSGIRTASGKEESVTKPEWAEAEDDIRGSVSKIIDQPLSQLDHSVGVGEAGYDVNIVGVRLVSIRRRIRDHQHAQFIICTNHEGMEDVYVAKRYGAFKKLYRELREEFPGRDIPHVPSKNRSSSTVFNVRDSISYTVKDNESDSISRSSSESSVSASTGYDSPPSLTPTPSLKPDLDSERRSRSSSTSLQKQAISQNYLVPREKNRLTLRSFLRQIIRDKRLARSQAVARFLSSDPITLGKEEKADIQRRSGMDRLRLEEQKRFVEESRQRAKELEEWLRGFKSELIRNQGLTKLFEEIRLKETIKELRPEYQKVIEWAKIEVAAVIYHLFVADDNAAEIFSQAQRIHGLLPYSIIKNILRFSNPVAMLRGILDLFLAQPFGQRSLLQRILSVTLNDDIQKLQKPIDLLREKVADDGLCDKLKNYVYADASIQDPIRKDVEDGKTELIVAILSCEDIKPQLSAKQIARIHSALDSRESLQLNEDAALYERFTQLLKLYSRQRDKQQIISLVFEGVTSSLLRDMITILYEPLAKVYQTANIYNSVMDLKYFVDDLIEVVQKAEQQDLSTDSNKLVQSFIDLCTRHEDKFYQFVHEVHTHDKELLFTHLMRWVEVILSFLRGGLSSTVDMNALIFETPGVDTAIALKEIDELIEWNKERKVWNERRLRAKMASAEDSTIPQGGFTFGDFGLDEDEVLYMQAESGEDEESDDMESQRPRTDDITEMGRKRRTMQGNRHGKDETSRSSEPTKPQLVELSKLVPYFVDSLRDGLSERIVT